MALIEALLIVVLLAAGVAAVYAGTTRVVGTITVFEYERALRFVRGRLHDELGPGRYRFFRPSTVLRTVDIRTTLLTVGGQEMLSKDGVAIKVSLTASYRVVDPRLAVLASDDYQAVLYTELQQALRVAVSGVDVDALLATRGELATQIHRDVQSAAALAGLAVERVAVRDLTLPGELKKLFAQVVQSRQEGLAALERARGETAALRSLANIAQAAERSPALLRLRMLQVAERVPALKVVIQVPGE